MAGMRINTGSGIDPKPVDQLVMCATQSFMRVVATDSNKVMGDADVLENRGVVLDTATILVPVRIGVS